MFSAKKLMIISLLSVLFLACGRSVQYRSVAEDEGGRTWGAREIKESTEKIVSSLYNYLKSTRKPAFLAVKKIRNRTAEHIDTKLLADEITSQLIRRGIRFIDISARGDSLKEIELSQTGLTSGGPDAGELKSPNYFLAGEITESVRFDDGQKVQYLLVTFRLIDVATTEIKWQDQKRFLKVSDNEKLSW